MLLVVRRLLFVIVGAVDAAATIADATVLVCMLTPWLFLLTPSSLVNAVVVGCRRRLMLNRFCREHVIF